MRTAFLLIFSLILGATVAQGQDKKDKGADKKEEKKEEKKPVITKDPTPLEGRWSVVSLEYQGKPTPAEKLKGFSMLFEGNQLTIKRGDKIIGQGTFTLDPKQKPATIDYQEAKDVFSPYDTGIYLLEGNTLKLCTTADRKNRPGDFDSKQGQVVVLKKATK
jgi:uncharacterized protein (TIGR03067 family)